MGAAARRDPFVDRVLPFRRERFFESLREYAPSRYDFAVDFQGLVKSAVVARLAGPRRIFGFAGGIARERAGVAVLFDPGNHDRRPHGDMRLDLAAAAGARRAAPVFPLPQDARKGSCPMASSCSPRRSRDGAPSNGPWSIYRELAQKTFPFLLSK